MKRMLLVCWVAVVVGVAWAEPPASPSDVERLIRQLGDDDFETRQAASRALAALEDRAYAALQAALEKSDDAEVRQRLEALLEPLRKSRPLPIRQRLGWITSLDISPDGKRVLIAADGKLRIWSLDKKKESRCFDAHDHPGVHEAKFSPDGKTVVSVCEDGKARLWDVSTGKLIRQLLDLDVGLKAVRFDPTGRRVVVGGHSGMHLIDTKTGKQLHDLRLPDAHAGIRSPVYSVAFSPDGARAFGGNGHGFVSMWNATTGEFQGVLGVLARVRGSIEDIAVSPDGKSLFVAGYADHVVRMWSLGKDANKVVREFRGHTAKPLSLAVSADGKTLLSVGEDSVVRVWDVATGKALSRFEHEKPLLDVVVSPDGRWLLSAGRDGQVWRRRMMPAKK